MFTPETLPGPHFQPSDKGQKHDQNTHTIYFEDSLAGEFGGNFLATTREIRCYTAHAGESESQPASLQSGVACPKNRPIPPCRLLLATDFDAFGAGPFIRPEAPSKMWVLWLMNIENSSGLSAFSATCRHSPHHVKPLVIEAMHPHSI